MHDDECHYDTQGTAPRHLGNGPNQTPGKRSDQLRRRKSAGEHLRGNRGPEVHGGECRPAHGHTGKNHSGTDQAIRDHHSYLVAPEEEARMDCASR
eukprot:3835165-Rhodomonas_salina.3